MLNYFTIYKPFQVLSQFSPEPGKRTLKDVYSFPKDVYPVGRLDYDSEGLLILTNDTRLNHRLLNPVFAHEREYWVQVEGSITTSAINALKNGVSISVNGKPYHTQTCNAIAFEAGPKVYDRNPPVRFRKNIPTSWVKLILSEGKNRQVRKMTAAVGFPTLRLIRYRIENITVDGLQPGGFKEWKGPDLHRSLGL